MEGLRVVEDGTYLDGTFGRGGHARGVLQKLGTGGRLLLMDKDPEAIAVAEREFGTDPRVAIHRGSFTDLAHWDAVAVGLDGVLLDLGVSSPQLDVAERGFSFGKDGPLDMRMDPDSGESAAQWLANASEQDIADVLWTYGEERMSRRIARAIVARRAQQPIERTADLAQLIASVMPRGKHDSIHPATRSFQAIRIHVNRELSDLEAGLDAALAALKPQGRLAVISFHSLEDRIVKQFIARHAKAPPTNRRLPAVESFVPTLRAIDGAQKAGAAELAANPRARSAVLRVAEKLDGAGLGVGDWGLGEEQKQSSDAGRRSREAAPLFRVPSPQPLAPASAGGHP
ncbi:16S rRNA (cytosine1402-N4)-methyltransferase [Luteimonas cucumeris]|uniref:Ribosomal RNA small subunit methyltransferase H n=2 Tax=Luteimonas cucumeris TaxID=985012 RepID=A0A562L5L5_9GAMM|nr:16S rRNA (cytosine1402-N4)-methyltransferase [Luteimonas cucumeris]